MKRWRLWIACFRLSVGGAGGPRYWSRQQLVRSLRNSVIDKEVESSLGIHSSSRG